MRLPAPESQNESTFDRYVRAHRLTVDQTNEWIAWIARIYTGPLYTRTYDEVEAFYCGWRSSKEALSNQSATLWTAKQRHKARCAKCAAAFEVAK